jgi:hypothetical protein
MAGMSFSHFLKAIAGLIFTQGDNTPFDFELVA